MDIYNKLSSNIKSIQRNYDFFEDETVKFIEILLNIKDNSLYDDFNIKILLFDLEDKLIIEQNELIKINIYFGKILNKLKYLMINKNLIKIIQPSDVKREEEIIRNNDRTVTIDDLIFLFYSKYEEIFNKLTKITTNKDLDGTELKNIYEKYQNNPSYEDFLNKIKKQRIDIDSIKKYFIDNYINNFYN